MCCAMRSLQVLYPKMIHFTCSAHGLHRLAEFIRDEFSDVNKLISSVKKIFTKVSNRKGFELYFTIFQKYIFETYYFQAPMRQRQFKSMFPQTSLPPQPIVTRWGSWIIAAVYFAENFDKIKDFLTTLDPEDISSKCN